jgi:hypothetical protein
MSMNSESSLDGQYIPEHNDLDNILADWGLLAARAYGDFLEFGLGTLVIEVSEDDKAELAFLPVASACCDECRRLLRPYDPQTQAVIAILREGSQQVYVLAAGLMNPKDAYEQATAKIFDETLH